MQRRPPSTSLRRALALGFIGMSAAACSYDWEAFVVDDDAGTSPSKVDAPVSTPVIDAQSSVDDARATSTDSGLDAIPEDDAATLDSGPQRDAALADNAVPDSGPGVDAGFDSAVVDARIDSAVVDAGVDATVVDAACTPSEGCLSSANLCAINCGTTRVTCQNNCSGGNPPCRSRCAQTEVTCRTNCKSVCNACTQSAACPAPTLCADATN